MATIPTSIWQAKASRRTTALGIAASCRRAAQALGDQLPNIFWGSTSSNSAWLRDNFAWTPDRTGFGGFTIPSRVSVGNHFGMEDYYPFFRVRITAARYLQAGQ